MTDQEITTIYPGIEWKKPITMQLADASGLACRLCIAARGFKGTDKERLFNTETDFAEHLKAEHPTV